MSLKRNYPWNVLILPAASVIGLEIHRALRDSKEVVLHGAVQSGDSIATFHFKRLHNVPSVYEPDCLSRLQELIKAQNIDAIFPAHDDVLLWLEEHAGELQATIIGSPLSTCVTCRSKSTTYDALRDILPVPRLWDIKANLTFPVFVKPNRGQGSQRARRIDDLATFEAALVREPDLIVMEYLPGREYTVDCFSSSGKVLFAQARERRQTKTGIATITYSSAIPEAHDWAERIAKNFDLRGAWFFQMKENAEGKLRLLEVAPRLAGSSACSHVAGPNFALMSLYEAAGHPISLSAFPSDMRMGRTLDARFIYDRPIEALYMDFDDTLVVHGAVNTRMVALVFQCRNRGIPVHLLTHHPGDLNAALTKYRLTGIFDRVIHVPDAIVPKAKFITEKNAVFIDDSFRERTKASAMHGIRCFDAAGAVCLLDERA